jgi:uncharacterized membrane protein
MTDRMPARVAARASSPAVSGGLVGALGGLVALICVLAVVVQPPVWVLILMLGVALVLLVGIGSVIGARRTQR